MESPTLRIRLLGQLDLRYGGARLPPLESARAGSLLAYLLLRRDAPAPRQHLAFLLWPDSTESQARTNLRHVLHTLRRALPDSDRFFEVTPRTLQWRVEAPFWLDVAAFEAAVAQAEREGAERETTDAGLAALREAVELYTGDVFEGCYDEWLLGERERLRQRFLEALAHLTTLLEARGDYAQAILYAERLLRYDPLHEETCRRLMRLHDARGDRARALRVYHVCAATLECELQIQPSAPTREAYEALLTPARDATAILTAAPTEVESQVGGLGGAPLVGRRSEWACLLTLWRAVETEGAGLVLVTGELGIGKTRLVEDFRSWCAHRGAVSATARSYPAEGALAYGPVVAWLRSEALKARLERLDRARLTELARLLPELLSEVPDLARPEPLPQSDQRQRLFAAAAGAILAVGEPLLLVADDLHWWDRESLQFLHYLLRVAPQSRLLVAATARREELGQRHPLHDLLAGLLALGRYTEVALSRLSREETAVLAEHFAGRPLGGPDATRFYDETEGNPLFVVEALRAGWKGEGATRSDGRTAEHASTSPKVQAVIQSRLAQLSEPARELVGVAATIGREFTAAVLADASDADEEALVRGLDELWRHRIVGEREGADAYDFSHGKIREIAYQALSPALRRRHHLRVAQALERRCTDDPESASGQIAGHYERAGAADQAVAWYARAAEAVQQVHANVEAIRLLGRALDLLRPLPRTPEREALELTLLIALPAPLVAVEGYQSSRLAEAHGRALELTAALGVEPAPPLLRSLALASLASGDFEETQRYGQQLRARGERDADDVLLVECEYVLGIAAFWQGAFGAARGHFEAAIGRYRPEHRRAHLLRYGQDPKAICLIRLGYTLWFLGHPAAAMRARDAALALAEEIGHPYSRSSVLVFAAMLAVDMHDVARLRQYAAPLAAGRDQEAVHSQAVADALNGYLDVLDGHVEGGLSRIQRTLDGSRGADHAPGQQAMVVRVLLQACVAAGDAHAGLAAAERALTMGGGAQMWAAEARRLRAEFLAALGASGEDVEAELERALQIARHQGARSLELRAAAGLLRHRLRRGDASVNEARQLVAGIVAAVPEGRDTHDLRAATALLARS